MTAAYDPRVHPSHPVLGPLVDGDLCDIRVFRNGKSTYCHQTATHAAIDVDGTPRLICAQHTAQYFPRAS